MRAEIKEKLIAILNEYRSGVECDEGKTFEELGIVESLEKVEILMRIEKEFKIVFSDNIKVTTVGELMTKIEKTLSQKK